MEYKDYYAILGIPRDADADQIKKAFRKLARENHPDTATDKVAAEAKFKEINEAHEVLSDPDKRAKYDALGSGWDQPRAGAGHASSGRDPFGGQWQGSDEAGSDFHFEGTGFSDFFEQFFGGRARAYQNHPGGGAAHHHARPMRGQDVEGEMLVTLEEALLGSLRPISMQRVNRSTGEVSTESFQVRIPPGATDGRRIRVPAKGEPGINGGDSGDLYLRIRHAAHPDFHAEGANIRTELEVAPWEGVLGASIDTPTLDGTIRLKVPPGSDTGRTLRVPGRGLPLGKDKGRGDFLVTIQVRLPVTLSEEEKILWEKLRDTSTFRPRED